MAAGGQYTVVGTDGMAQAAQTSFFITYGRTDLRIRVSRAKFDTGVDFEVHFALAP